MELKVPSRARMLQLLAGPGLLRLNPGNAATAFLLAIVGGRRLLDLRALFRLGFTVLLGGDLFCNRGRHELNLRDEKVLRWQFAGDLGFTAPQQLPLYR